MPNPFDIRHETPGDAPAVRAVHVAAFGGVAEADLVNALRAAGKATVSLVAEAGGAIVGHVLFSPVTLRGTAGSVHRGMGLAPLAVLPAWQRRGVGAALMRAGLEECRRLRTPWVVLVGWPEYYRRFGFVPAARFGLRCVFSDGDSFQALELIPGGLPEGGGFVEYAAEFAAFE